jgi:hypothetical protein
MTARCCVRLGTAIAGRLLLAGVAVTTAAPAAYAQVITSTWTGVSGNWTNAALWSSNPNYPNNGNPPGATYAAKLLYTPGSLALDTPITVQSLDIGGNVLVNLSGSALSVTGTTHLNITTANLDVPLSTGSLTMEGGLISGSRPITVNGSFGWLGGTVQGTGPVTVAGGIDLGEPNYPPPVLSGRSLTVTGGTAYWSSAQTFTMQGAAVFTVGSGATFTALSSEAMSGGTFVVNGSFSAPGSVYGVGPILSPFINTGTVDIGTGLTVSSMTNSGRVHVASGGGLGGSITSSGAAAIVTGAGTYTGGALTFNGGRLAPGDGIGRMTVNEPVTMFPGSIFEAELGGPSPALYDQLNITGGSITLNGPSLNTLLEYAPTPADALTIVLGGPVTGTFAGLPNGTEFYVGRFNNTDYVGTITYTPTSVVLNNLHPVPEPFAWLLTGGAAVGWAMWRKSRRRAPAE